MTSAARDLILSASTDILGGSVKIASCDTDGQILTINDIFEASYQEGLNVCPSESFQVQVKSISTKKRIILNTQGEDTFAELKDKIESAENIPADRISLLCSGNHTDDDQTLASAGVGPESSIRMLVHMKGGEYHLDLSQLDPAYDYDFTDEKPVSGRSFKRGGYKYNRPYGWKRVALRVKGKYRDDKWLGLNGFRTSDVSGEWPVSYHGTGKHEADSILENGFSPGRRAAFGRGVYSSPSIEMVGVKYARSFRHTDGLMWQIAFQNRVNPARGHLKVIGKSTTYVGADYWLSPKQDVNAGVIDVRPYGLLFRKAPIQS